MNRKACESKRVEKIALLSHKAPSYEKPFIGFTNSIHLNLAKVDCYEILTDHSIIDRPILISYVSIAYLQGRSRRIAVSIEHMYVPALRPAESISAF